MTQELQSSMKSGKTARGAQVLYFLCFLVLFVSSCAPRRASTSKAELEKSPKIQSEKPQKTLSPRYSEPNEVCIVIDSGHGGDDSGTKSIQRPIINEKTLTLRTAMRVQEFLKKMGYTVKLTRSRDVFIPLPLRVKYAQDVKADLFVSIHFNHAPNTQAHGIEVYYYKNTKDPLRSQCSKELATFVLQRIVATCKARSRGVMHGDFHVVRETKMPSILVEGGFLSNQQETTMLRNPKYIRFLAMSIAKGIDDYAKKHLLQTR